MCLLQRWRPSLCFAPIISWLLVRSGCLTPSLSRMSHLHWKKGDHPRSELLDQDGITKYQSLIGSLQWLSLLAGQILQQQSWVCLVSELHPEWEILSALSKLSHAVIFFLVDPPDYSNLPILEYDWSQTVYGDVHEMIPKDIPRPLGKYVVLAHYVDTNLYHDMITGRSVTGSWHMMKGTPIDWFSKKQATVETVTYGFLVCCIQDMCWAGHRSLYNFALTWGVLIMGRSHMFGDNKSVVNSSSIPHSKLHKRHATILFHWVWEAVSSDMLAFHYIPGEINPADILSKHWGYQQVWCTLQPLLFGKVTQLNSSSLMSKACPWVVAIGHILGSILHEARSHSSSCLCICYMFCLYCCTLLREWGVTRSS